MKKLLTAALLILVLNATSTAQNVITQNNLNNVVSSFLSIDNNKGSLVTATATSNSKSYAAQTSFSNAIETKVIEYFHPANPNASIGKRMHNIFYAGANLTDAKAAYYNICNQIFGKEIVYNNVANVVKNEIPSINDKNDNTTYGFEFGGTRRLSCNIAFYKKGNNYQVEMNIYEIQKIAD